MRAAFITTRTIVIIQVVQQSTPNIYPTFRINARFNEIGTTD